MVNFLDILYCYLNDAWFFKGGKCGCFVLIKNDLWSIWVPRKNWMIVVRIKIKEEMHRFLHLKYYFLIMEMSIGMWFLLMFGWVCLELVWLSFSTELESEREREREREREKERERAFRNKVPPRRLFLSFAGKKEEQQNYYFFLVFWSWSLFIFTATEREREREWSNNL